MSEEQSDVIAVLEDWQEATIQALAMQQVQIKTQAEARINKLQQAIDSNARTWAGRENVRFEQRNGSLVIVEILEEDDASD